MKVRLHFKTPDVMNYATQQCDASEEEQQKAKELIKRFVLYDECVTLEFDTELGTAMVLPKKR